MKNWNQYAFEQGSKESRQQADRRANIIGILCGAIVLVLAAVNIIVARIPAQAGVRDSEVPENAVTLTGSAPGRNGDITVTVVTDGEAIYQIRIDDHEETEDIGTEAVKQLPSRIYKAQTLNVDGVSGATISSRAIKNAVMNALESGGYSPTLFGNPLYYCRINAEKVETKSGVVVTLAKDWAGDYPTVYASWDRNSENSEVTDYLVDYPMLRTLYEPYGFSKDYKAARGHTYTLEDVVETKRTGENSKASCWTCKTPQFTNMVNEQGTEVYSGSFMALAGTFTEPISCYTCHANQPGTFTVTHTYLIDALGEDFDTIDARTLSCGQCHNEYFFDPGNGGATTLPHNSLASMHPDEILAFFNDGSNFPDGQPFADYVNPRTGVRQIKVQHPELETFLGEGSPHRADFSCADCHMGETVAEDGSVWPDHYLQSPLDNRELLQQNCAKCHEDLTSQVRDEQARIEDKTYRVGYELEDLTELLAKAVADDSLNEKDLEAVRSLARDAQFYWDFVFVENSEGVHNPKLSNYCLDKASELCSQAVALLDCG